jgi:hypothetical protein
LFACLLYTSILRTSVWKGCWSKYSSSWHLRFW